jgi:plasmid stability protein
MSIRVFLSPLAGSDRLATHLAFHPPDAIMIARRINVAQVIVRNLEESVKRKLKLKQRAARHGHSMEQEIRDILRSAVKQEKGRKGGLGSAVAARFKGIGLEEDIPELRGFPVKPAVFDE